MRTSLVPLGDSFCFAFSDCARGVLHPEPDFSQYGPEMSHADNASGNVTIAAKPILITVPSALDMPGISCSGIVLDMVQEESKSI